MLSLRKKFDHVDEHTERLLNDQMIGCIGVSLIGDYIENKDGNLITSHEIMVKLNGPHIVIMGDFSSLENAVGKSPMRSGVVLDVSESNILSHYLSVVEQIYSSQWYKQRPSLKSRGKSLLSAELPSIHDTRSVAILFRQLYERNNCDRLFIRSVDSYIKCVDSDIKRIWIDDIQGKFTATLSSSPFGIETEHSGEEFLEAIGYGYRIFHAVPRRAGISQLRDLIAKYGEERVLFSYDVVLRILLNHCANLYRVIKMDYSNWIDQGICPKPDLLDFKHLIGR